MPPNGLVPSLLGFGTFPSFSVATENTAEQEVHIEIMQTARNEVARIPAEQRIATAVKTSVPPSAKFKLKPGDILSGYSEAKRKWKQGLLFVEVYEKQMWINTGRRVLKLNISRVLLPIVDKEECDIMTLLKSLTTFRAEGPPGVWTTE